MGLADYKGVLGTAASISSFVLLLSPSVLCLKIWKNKSSNNIPFPPLMEAMARSILMFQQGLVMGVWPIMITHTIGLLLNTTYITIYLTFTKDKKYVIASKSTKDLPFPIIATALCVTFLWTLYSTAIEKPALQIQTGAGFCVCAFELSLFAIYPSNHSDSKQKPNKTEDDKKKL
uniref:Sugar transporter SWEET1 n=1 Tax=Graphocephala atropunctata TaxID=36148 RepID=A0A1B6KT37_9HEMI